MSVTVPSTEKTGIFATQSHITALAAGPQTTHNIQLKKQKEEELVHALLGQGKLNAALIISTLPVTNKSNALYASITAQTALITAYGSTAPAVAAGQVLDSLQRQLVAEEMSSGARTAASILASS